MTWGAPGRPDRLPILSVFAIACGAAVGVLMLAFRETVEGVQALFLPGRNPENYEALDTLWRVALPCCGGLVLGLMLQRMAPHRREVGPAHVIDCLETRGARLPAANALVQFVGGALSIIFGHSVGREGPAIHLGATSGSLLGQAFGLSESELRVLGGCGIAAAIAASFNTPLAGVVFAMEVVLMEYSVTGFAPVILAAVTATAINRLAYGTDPAFVVPALALRSLWELPYVLAVGAIVGVVSSAFIALLGKVARHAAQRPCWQACTLGGIAVAVCAVPCPQVMGIGYDTVGLALLGQLSLTTMATIVLFKLLATTIGVGMGLPGGVIGPMLVIGAAAGGVLGIAGQLLSPELVSSVGFYVLVGMGAMMAGTLHAPLAALTAMLELTGNPNVIWPGMLAAIGAYAISRSVFRQEAVFSTLLHAKRARKD